MGDSQPMSKTDGGVSWDNTLARAKAKVELAPFPAVLRYAMFRAGIMTLSELRERAKTGIDGLAMNNIGPVRAREILRILGEIGIAPHCVTCQCWKL